MTATECGRMLREHVGWDGGHRDPFSRWKELVDSEGTEVLCTLLNCTMT